MAKPATVAVLPPITLELLAEREAEALLRAGLQRHPADVWLNWGLARLLWKAGGARAGQAEAFLRAAVAARPLSLALHNNLGALLHELKRPAEAEAAYRLALKLRP